MEHYYRTLALVATILVVVLLLTLTGGCTNHIARADKMVGGGTIDQASGRVTVGGCVETIVVEKR